MQRNATFRFAGDTRGAVHLIFALSLVPCAAAAAAAVDYSRANRSKADLQSAADAAALSALNAPTRGKALEEAGKVLRSSTTVRAGSAENLNYNVKWIGQDTVEVTANLTVKGQFGSVLTGNTQVGVLSRATKSTASARKLVIRPISNCPYARDKMSLTVVETERSGNVKRHPVYSNATPLPSPITVELGGDSTFRLLLTTEQRNRSGTIPSPNVIESYADTRPAYFEQTGEVCDKTRAVVHGWETPFDPAPYALFQRIRYEYTCDSSTTAGEARLVR